MGEKGNSYRVLMGKSEENKPLERSRHSCEDSIKWILKKWNGWALITLMWLTIDTRGGLFWKSNEPSGSVKCREFD